MHVFRTFIFIATLAGPLSAAVPPTDTDTSAADSRSMESYRLVLLRRHAFRNDAAMRGDMPPAFASACAQNFLALKLSFVPDATPEGLGALQPVDRAKANAAGYEAYRAWLAGQVDRPQD